MNASGTGKRIHPIGRFFAFLGVTLLCVLLILLGLLWVLERGPSPTVTGMFTRSVRETSAIRWLSNIFLTDEELDRVSGGSDGEGDVPDGEPEAIKMKLPNDITTLIR